MTRPLLVPLAALLGTLLFVGAAGAAAPGAGSSQEGERPRERRPDAGPRPQRVHTCPICALARKLNLQMTPLRKVRRVRCAPPPLPPITALLPRGRVRSEELTHVHVRLGIEFLDDEPGPWIEFRRGGSILQRLTFAEPEWANVRIPVPRSLLRELRRHPTGVTWGRILKGRSGTSVPLRLEDPTPEESGRLAGIQERLSLHPTWIRRLLGAQALLEAEFVYGAHIEAQAVLAENPREPHAAAIVQYTLQVMRLPHDAAYVRFADEVLDPLRAERDRLKLRCMLEEPLTRTISIRNRNGVRIPGAGCGGD